MKRFRKILFRCHLIAGASAGVVILIMSVTGVLLTYEKQMMHWADTRGMHVAPPAPGAARLPIDTLIERVTIVKPDAAIQTVTLRNHASEPAVVILAGGGTLYLDPYTGAVLGPGSPAVRDFFRSVTNWHRWLAMSGDRRGTGKAITGAANLIFLFIVCSGLYLWLPRVWSRLQFKNILWFRGGLAGKARDFNWHNVAGIWCAVPLAIVVASATIISYTWAGNLVYRAAGETPPAPVRSQTAGMGTPGEARGRSAEGPANGPRKSAAPADGPAAGSAAPIDAAWARAEGQVADWRIISLRLPANGARTLAFTIDRGTGGQPHKRGQLTLDRASGALVKWEPFSSQTRGRQLRLILRFAHTGEVLGLAGQTIAGVASAAGVLLVYTGLALSLRRFLAWRQRQAASRRVPQAVAIDAHPSPTQVAVPVTASGAEAQPALD